MFFDDIGSYPPPDNLTREDVQQKFHNLHAERDLIWEMLQNIMQQKIDAGVEIPTYPQMQDMNRQFLHVITDSSRTEHERPFVVLEEEAHIIELDAIEKTSEQYYEQTGSPLQIRVCVTGPVELHLGKFGNTVYGDVLETLAISIGRFVQNSLVDTKAMKTTVISIDEPSVGINPELIMEDEAFIRAMDIASEPAHRKDVDVQIHLHAPIEYKKACQTRNINVIGLESAANPQYLDIIDRKDLEHNDKSLRVGVARTDIFRMASEYSEKYNSDVWQNPDDMMKMINMFETPENIAARLKKAYTVFDDLITYVGPDCGLGTWPSQEAAFVLLRNTAEGISKSRSEHQCE